MLVEIITKIGEPPLVVDASLVIVRHANGTPVMACGMYGPDDSIRASHALDADFNSTLHKLGINRTVITDRLVLPPPPPGAKLIRGPNT